ncbi:hypothetical protein HELRODRAFT_72557 [Helobdella robusta]|uniref:EEF1A lysine methyltransferase 4 n=1 Tax=Helobdella robusta TaxID=6412 RepID=T1G117_HELRO|nr:hypothetical protein HELRODRAFT_72557 [Helobdella robusta]ESO10732.1 hypothetical protein HELRODRAFT_72557 [Helobdella robusta]
MFARVEYWNQRYDRDESKYDWFIGYEACKRILERNVKNFHRILHLGCGNSSLPIDMWLDGYKDITNMDYSRTVIESMQQRTKNMEGLKWIVADINNMTGDAFQSEKYDVIIEKGTLDALLASEVDPWICSQDTETMMDHILRKISALLRDGGRFISITFAQPHFRVPLYALSQYGWSVRYETIGDHFHYFCYVMTKGEKLDDVSIEYRIKYTERRDRKLFQTADNRNDDNNNDSDNDDEFLSRISESV